MTGNDYEWLAAKDLKEDARNKF